MGAYTLGSTKVPLINSNEYKRGYDDGVSAASTPGADVVGSIFFITESPSYRKGWHDGYNGREYCPGERGLFDTDDEESEHTDQEETEDTDDNRDTSTYDYPSSSSGGYEPTVASTPAPLTESEKRKRLFGRVVLVSAFFISVAYDSMDNNFGVVQVAYGVYAAIMSYVAYRVAYRLKFWLTPFVLLNAVLFFREIPTTPVWKVLHHIVVSDISNLVGIALIYGIYKFFTQ